MIRTKLIGSIVNQRHHQPSRSRQRAPKRRPSSPCRPQLELLENRVTPSVNPATPFELDGNVTTTTAHDWDQVFADAGSPSGSGSFTHGTASGALAGSFFTDKVNTSADDIFQGGGSKDTLGIQQGRWLFTASKPQGKDDITHAYASAYIDSNQHLILYAGMDRYDNSGDSTAGFWFFGNNIGENPNVTTNGGHPFTGQHADGDILLVSDFTIGGSTSTIKVFRWTGNDSTGSLVALNNGNPIGGNTFATVNSSPISVPWSYTNKSGQSQPAAGEFLEEGIDLTALGLQGCFSSFLAETRSSQSPTATLSDFVVGSFPLCTLGAPQLNGLSKVGDSFTYPLTVTNTGASPLFIQSVTDTLLGNIVVNHTLQQPGAAGVNQFVTAIDAGTYNFSQPLAPGASLTILVSRTVQAGDSDPTVSTVSYIGTDDLAGTQDQITASATNTVNLFQPSATLTLSASPGSAVVGTPITYTYMVTNTSSSDSPNLVLDLSNPNDSFIDTLLGNIEADAIAAMPLHPSAGVGSVAPGGSFSFTETRTLLATDPEPLTNSAEGIFTLAQNLGTFTNRIHAPSQVATVNIVDANVSIAPDAVNAVGQPHTFTVTVNQLLNGGSPTPAAGATVTVTLTDSNGAVDVPAGSLTGTTDVNGHFFVTFTSQTAGIVTGHATATLTVNGVPLTRATDGTNGSTGDATKRFVDATIGIAPNATNGITEPHTFTVTVLQNDGLGGGFVAAGGANVTVTLTNSGGAVANPAGPITGTTDGSGQFQVTFTSNSPGTVTGNATATLTVSGVSLTRATGDSHTGDSGSATKTFVAGSLKWLKEDSHGNLLGGATFVVTATGGDALNSTPLSVTVVDNGPNDADPTPGVFVLKPFQSFLGSPLTGLALGSYTVQETVAPTGFNLDPSTQTATLTLAAPNGDLSSSPFIDTQPNLSIVKAVSPGFASVIHPGDTASFTITVTNSGDGSASNVSVTDNLPESSKLSWSATSTGFIVSISGGVLTATDATVAAGATATITISAVIPTDIFGNIAGTANGDPVPLGLFELDGNATTGVLGSSGSTTTSHDWDQVFADATNGTTTSGANAVGFTTDKVNSLTDDIFTGGGSKDVSGIQKGPWLFTDAKPQGKDDITHAFAAQYVDPATNDVILYAGMDRFDNSGDSTAGFWFFVNPIGEGAISKGNGTGPFTGTHTDGDILLVSDFTIGGSTSTIRVFKWVGNDSTGSLVALNSGNAINGSTFAIVNSAPISVPWAFTDKHNNTRPQAGEFLEEGVNLSALGLPTCFSTFLGETRSSQSPTATLSDFVLGSFDTCNLQLPNQASLSYNIPGPPVVHVGPITSNQVLIAVNDGHPLEATATGSGAAATSLSQAQLQPMLAQAANYWLAAGVAAPDLHALDNVTVEFANLSGRELGLETPGHIWLDQTAAGWGWSVDGGQMDLQSVLTHEVGHTLGFEHSASGVMEATLAPGARLLPETITGTETISAMASLPGATAVETVSVGSHERGALAASSATGVIDAAFANLLRGVLTQPGNTAAEAGLAALAAGDAHALVAVMMDRAMQVPLMAAGSRGPGDVRSDELVLPADQAQVVDGAITSAPRARPSAPPLEASMGVQVSTRLEALPCDAVFAGNGSRQDEDAPEGVLEYAGPVSDAAAAAAALAVVLGPYWHMDHAEPEQRSRRRFRI
jgi:uncharacterized repeat protein (TIGR01451 family)